MKKILIFVLSGLYIFTSAAGLFANEVKISSNPVLPLPNYVKNGSFEKGFESWKPNSKSCTIISKDKFKCSQILGAENAKPNIMQNIKLTEPIPAGAPIYIGFASKAEDCDIDAKPPRMSFQVSYTNGERAYLPTPFAPIYPHEWVYCERIVKTKQPIESIYLHLCYYNQTGKSYWDDVVVKAGNVELNFNITGKDIKQIKVFSSLEGMIFKSKILSNKNSFKKSLSVPGFATYYVQAEDHSGKTWGQRYPAEKSAPAKATANSIPIFSRFNSEVLNVKEQDLYAVELPDISGKNVFLEMTVRLDTLQQVAGFTPALMVEINGKKLTSKNLFNRKSTFTRASGDIHKIMGAGLFNIYYSPWAYAMNEDNKYCPVDIPGKNPFIYKFRITELVKSGRNEITIGNFNHNKTRKVKMFISNCRINISSKQ